MKNRPLVAEGLSPLLLLRKNENGQDIAFSVAMAIPSHASELASIDHAWGQGWGLRKHLPNEKRKYQIPPQRSVGRGKSSPTGWKNLVVPRTRMSDPDVCIAIPQAPGTRSFVDLRDHLHAGASCTSTAHGDGVLQNAPHMKNIAVTNLSLKESNI
ncbi:unnamed protein product [Ectocarpus sp. 4 AP-2014]